MQEELLDLHQKYPAAFCYLRYSIICGPCAFQHRILLVANAAAGHPSIKLFAESSSKHDSPVWFLGFIF